MQLIEKTTQRIFYVLYDTSGNPKTGLNYSDITFRLVKANQSSFTIKTLSEGSLGNFSEVGFGFYWTDLVPADVDILGELAIAITGAEIDTKHLVYQIVSQSIVASGNVPLCTIFGNIRDLGGEPTGNRLKVISQILKLPQIVGGNFITTGPKIVFTDEDGMFKMKLVIGAVVRVEIEDAGLRRQFMVPDQTTADLKDLPSV